MSQTQQNINQIIQENESKLKSEQHIEDSLYIFLGIVLLCFVVLTIWLLKYKRFSFVHETSLAIFYGAIIGALLRYAVKSDTHNSNDNPQINTTNSSFFPEFVYLKIANTTTTIIYAYKDVLNNGLNNYVKSKATFDPEIFFNLLLPPIIFNAGYSMKRKNFFKNFGAILIFSLIGTTISCLIIGALLFWIVKLPSIGLGFSDCLLFGALISATDPVTTLAIFQDKNVDLNLYSMIFGESVLNDAVSIILVQQIEKYGISTDIVFDIGRFFEAIGSFFGIFFGSLGIGALMGCINALLTKFTKIKEQPVLETALFVLISISAFQATEACAFSGIVAILICGVFQAHYTYNNLSEESQVQTRHIFHLASFLAENFIFVYIGITMFTFQSHNWNAGFIFCSFFAIAVGRALNIYPLSFLINLSRKPDHKIAFNNQHLMFFSGLRGAMAFALAIRNVATSTRQMILTTTSIIVIVTVIFCGGLTPKMIELLHIRSADIKDSTEDENPQENVRTKEPETDLPMFSLYKENSPEIKTSRFKEFILKLGIFKFWHGFDKTFMKPFLTHYTPSLIENMPKKMMPLARLLTSREQIEKLFKSDIRQEPNDKIDDNRTTPVNASKENIVQIGQISDKID